MSTAYSRYFSLAVLAGLFAGTSCGSGHPNSGVSPSFGGTPTQTGSNIQAISVNAGVTRNFINGIFTNVTVCVPNTTNCQTINNILVDTGSFGLRLLSSGGGGAFALALPDQTDANGNAIAECTKFVDLSFIWGPVRMADVKLAGETASSVPVNVVADSAFATVPSNCSGGGTNADTVQALAANGILGVGPFQQDCGPGCAMGTTPPAGIYYSCPTAATCQPAFVSLAKQVQNPIAFFATDNNGVIIQLPTVSAAGSTTLSGSMIFGIGTQTNNALGSARVFPIDPSTGNFTTIFKSQTISNSFIDSGSNGFFFLDTTATGIATCGNQTSTPGFYCPTSTQNLSATQEGFGGIPAATVSFQIANANNLVNADPTATAFVDLGGPGSGMFDWGLPFFYGRTVFTAIAGKPTPAGTGPFWAY
jgi:Protein of unknown function (DUF3443)